MSTTSSEIISVSTDTQDLRIEEHSVTTEITMHTHKTLTRGRARLFFLCMVSLGLQYFSALQMSILSTYIQTLGVPHEYSSMVWMLGPILGFFVNPIVGHYSDHCTMRMGRRRPFIILQCLALCISVMLMAFSVDIGQLLGDTMENCSTYTGPRRIATAIYIIGVLVSDCSLHSAQGTVRAMMSDLSVSHGLDIGQAIFVVWMSMGNVLGNVEAAYGKWNRWFPFLKTTACCEACANLKGASITVVVIIMISTTVTVMVAHEKPIINEEIGISTQTSRGLTSFINIFKSLRDTKTPMRKLLALTTITWMSWFPFLQFCTDWMGREIYHGKPNGTVDEIMMYNKGVREGALGLLLTSVSFGATSLLTPYLCRKLTSKVVWSVSLLMMFLIMVGMVSLGIFSTGQYNTSPSATLIIDGPDVMTRAIALTMFFLIGAPQAVLYNVPWVVAAELTSADGGGQGVTVGLMTFVISLSQLIVGLTAGPIDGVFHQGNAPAFGIGGAIGLVGAALVVKMLPRVGNMDGMQDTDGVAGARS